MLGAAGASASDVRFRYGLDARYSGQGNEVTVWVGTGDAFPTDDAGVLAAFEAEYRRIYGLTIPDIGIEVVTWRLAVVADAERVDPGMVPPALLSSPDAVVDAPRRVRQRRRHARHAGLPTGDARCGESVRRSRHRRGTRDDRGHPSRVER